MFLVIEQDHGVGWLLFWLDSVGRLLLPLLSGLRQAFHGWRVFDRYTGIIAHSVLL
jgi:hypothetical protein